MLYLENTGTVSKRTSVRRSFLMKKIEYAAAFFLLADCLKDAVNVILNQLKDLQLAIAVIRVYEGERGPILRELLEEKVLPLAAQEGNRWLASWAFWMLHRRDMAVRALIVSRDLFLIILPLTESIQVACVHSTRDATYTRSSCQALLDRRPCTRHPLLAAPAKDSADFEGRLQSHPEGRMGIRTAQCRTIRSHGL